MLGDVSASEGYLLLIIIIFYYKRSYFKSSSKKRQVSQFALSIPSQVTWKFYFSAS